MATFEEIMAQGRKAYASKSSTAKSSTSNASGAQKKNLTFNEIMAQGKKATASSQSSGAQTKAMTFDEIMEQGRKAVASTQSGSTPVTLFTAEQAQKWVNDAVTLGNSASKWYGKSGWVTPNNVIIQAIDAKLADAGKVRQYFVANRTRLQNADATIEQVNSLIDGLSQISDYGKNANAVFSQYKNAEEYNEAGESAKQYDKWASYDLEGTAGAFSQKTDIVTRQTDRNALYDRLVATTAEQLRANRTSGGLVGTSHLDYTEMAKSQIDAKLKELATLDPNSAEYRQMVGTDLYRLAEQDRVINDALKQQGYDDYDTFKSAYDSEEYKRRKAAYIQKGIAAYEDAVSAVDFQAKSQYDPNERDKSYRYINGETLGAKAEENLPALFKNVRGYMNADEIAVYNYYFNTCGEEAANRYLQVIEDALTTRKASEVFEGLEGKTLREFAFTTIVGPDQFASGMKNTLSGREDYIPPSAVQKASAQVSEDVRDRLGPGAKMAYNALTSITNMAPSVLASVAAGYLTTKVTGSAEAGAKVGKFVGTGLMAASAKGNAYAEAINNGYTKEQAHVYSTLVAASEVGLSSVLSGVSQIGGAATGRVLKAVDDVDKTFSRIASKTGTSFLSEGVEEGLQEMLTPLFKRIAADERESINWGAVAESFVIGGLVGAVWSGPQIIAADVHQTRVGNTILNGGQMTEGLKDLALQLPDTSEARKAAEALGDNPSAYRVGGLFQQVCEEYGVSEKVGAGIVVGNTLRLMEKRGEVNLADAVAPALESATNQPQSVTSQIVSETNQPQSATSQIISETNQTQSATSPIISEIYQPQSVAAQTDSAVAETITPEEIAQAKRDTGLDITPEDASEADASIDEDQAVFSSPSIAPPSTIYDESQVTAYQNDFARKVSKELSREVYQFDGSTEEGSQAGFVGKNGAIYINMKSPVTRNAFSIVIGHEYVHTLEGTKEYTVLRDAVFASETFSQILANNGMTKEQLIAQVQSGRAAAGETLTVEAVERELVAQFVAEQLLQNGRALKQFAKTSAFAQFAVRVRRFLFRMTHRIGKNPDLVKIERLLQQAVRAAAKNPAATQSGEVRSYINPNFAAEYAAWDKKTQGGYFYLGTTSKALQSVGIDPSKIYWDKSKIKDILENPTHNMKNAIVKVPDILENPILIMQSQTTLNRVVLISEVVDDNNVPVVCAIELTPNGRIDTFVKVASAYGKDSGLQTLIDKSDILYVDPNKKRTDTWLKAFRLQLPTGLTKYGSIGRVTLFKRNVKGEVEISQKHTPKTTFEIAFEKAQTSTDNHSTQNSEKDAQNPRSYIPFGFSMGADTVTPTRRSRFNRASVDEQAKRLMQTASSKGDRAELVRVLENFYEYVAQGQELSWDGINEAARPVVDWLTEHHASRNTVDVYAAEALEDIRAISMRLTEAQAAEAATLYGSYGEYHRKTFGSIPFSKHAMITLTERWQELADVYPEYFDPNENETNMPIRLPEIVDSLRATNTAAEEYQRNLPEVRRDLASAVYDSYWNVSEVRSERDRYEDRVYDLKEQHRAEMREERARGERAVAEERARGDMRVKQERQRAGERETRLKEQHRVQRERAADRQTRAEMREKIRKVVKELNSMLLKGKKEKPVIKGLSGAVAAALDAVQMTDAEGYEQAMQRRLAYYDQRLYEETDPQKIKQLQEEREKAAQRLESMKNRLAYLSTAYAEIVASDDASMQIYKHDAAMVKVRVETVMEIVGDTPLRHMNLRQLEAVHDLYTMVKTTVDNANKIFKEGKAEELSKNAESIMDEVAEHGSLEENGYKETTAIRDAFRSFTWSELKPIYAFRKLGSKTLMSLYGELRRGEDVVARDVREASAYAQKIREKYGWNEWDVKKTYTFKMPDGRTLPLTLPQMMSIYAYSKRPQAQKHIEQGGFVFSDKETFKQERGLLDVTRSSSESWRVNAWLLTEIASKMKEIDKNCMAYVDEMQKFLSDVMGEKGNEVSRVMWGIDLFKEKNYFPLKSSQDFMFEQSTVNPAMALKSSGMTKRTTPHAANPIVLEGFDQVWAGHVVQMSNYHGFVIPIDNLNKVTNYAVYLNEDHPQSVTTVIGSVFGKSANEYIEKLLQDVNGGVKAESAVAFFPKMIGNAKKTAVAASMSTVVQQPTAIVRAMAMIDPKYFVGKYDARKHGVKWDELKEYAPVAIIKEIGGFDTTSSRGMVDWLNQRQYQGVGAKAKALLKDAYYRDDKLMMAAAKADEIGWITIWEAVKREQQGKSKLDPASKEFLQKCGERFTEVIEYTQVYDSTLSRSGMMRSKSEFMKMATAFMGEPTTSFNMLLDAVTDTSREGRKTTMHAGRVVAAVYVSQLMASAAASAIYALRDDDDDEAYLDKWAEQFGKKISSEVWVHNMIPFVRDIASIADGWDVERMDMAIFADLYNAVTSLGSESKSAFRKVEDLAGAIGALGGLPVRNMIRTCREVGNAVRFAFDGVTTDGIGHPLLEGMKNDWVGDVLGLFPKKGEVYEQTVEAIQDGERLPKKYRKDDTVLTLADLYDSAKKERERIEEDASLTYEQKKDMLGDYDLGAIVKSGELGKNWTTVDGDLVSDDEKVTDEATALMRRTYKSYLDLLIPSKEFQQADTAERIDMVGEVYEDVKAMYKQAFKTMETEDAIDTFATYHEKVSSGRYDPDLVNAFATVKLADGKPLVTSAALCKRYESAVEEIYEARMKKVGAKYEWTKDGVKNTIYVARATTEERAFIEERERELAREDVAKLFRDVDAATLVEKLSRDDAYTVKKNKKTKEDGE